jgi:hypothetical protein
MKEIDKLLEKWIKNSIIREEVKEAIVKHKMESMDLAYSAGHEAGIEAGFDYKYKQNTNEDG